MALTDNGGRAPAQSNRTATTVGSDFYFTDTSTPVYGNPAPIPPQYSSEPYYPPVEAAPIPPQYSNPPYYAADRNATTVGPDEDFYFTDTSTPVSGNPAPIPPQYSSQPYYPPPPTAPPQPAYIPLPTAPIVSRYGNILDPNLQVISEPANGGMTADWFFHPGWANQFEQQYQTKPPSGQNWSGDDFYINQSSPTDSWVVANINDGYAAAEFNRTRPTYGPVTSLPPTVQPAIGGNGMIPASGGMATANSADNMDQNRYRPNWDYTVQGRASRRKRNNRQGR